MKKRLWSVGGGRIKFIFDSYNRADAKDSLRKLSDFLVLLRAGMGEGGSTVADVTSMLEMHQIWHW
jgi:hypothetical protein